MHALSAFAVGLIFGIGLLISGMTDPSKIIGFLNLAGPWDPSLAFVMDGAVAVGFIAFRFARGRTAAFLGGEMRLPTARRVDRRLVLGGLVFGIGWGLAGYCPGPVVVSVGMGQDKAIVFGVAMLAGTGIYELVERFRQRRES